MCTFFEPKDMYEYLLNRRQDQVIDMGIIQTLT